MPNNAPTENHSFDATAISTINQISAILIDTKIFLYLANGIILLLGIGLLVYGIYGCRLPGPQLYSCQTSVPMGVLTCLLTFLWFLAYRLNQLPLHFIYLILLICVIASQLVFAFRTLVVGNEAVIKSHLRNLYKLRKDTGEVHKEVEEFQTRLNCCGFDGPHDSIVAIQANVFLSIGKEAQGKHNVTILISECCPNHVTVCTILDAYREGCAQKMIKEHREWESTFGIILFITALVLIVFAFVDVAQFQPIYT